MTFGFEGFHLILLLFQISQNKYFTENLFFNDIKLISWNCASCKADCKTCFLQFSMTWVGCVYIKTFNLGFTRKYLWFLCILQVFKCIPIYTVYIYLQITGMYNENLVEKF